MRWTVMVLMVACSGCAFIEPVTEIKVNPVWRTISIYNSKDVDFTVEKMTATWNPDGGGLEVTNLVISDKSSPVIEANVQQMLAFVEQQRAANEGIIGSLNAIGSMVQTLSGATQAILRGSSIGIDTEWGSGSATLGTPTTQPPP